MMNRWRGPEETPPLPGHQVLAAAVIILAVATIVAQVGMWWGWW